MIIDWPYLIGAILLLWIPSNWLYPAAAKDRLTDYRSSRFRLEQMLQTWQHWFDLIRGFGGTLFLVTIGVRADLTQPNDLRLHLAVTGVILVVAVAAQTIHWRRVFVFTAPVFFVWGVTFALLDWVTALFAILFSAALARLINHIDLKFPTMAALVAVVGFLTQGFSFHLILACILVVLPVVLAYAAMHPMVCYTREFAIT